MKRLAAIPLHDSPANFPHLDNGRWSRSKYSVPLIFRFLAGLFAATPLTCVGSTVADLWTSLQKTYAFIIYTIPAFNGPMIGQVIGSYIPTTLGWRWLEWIMLIFEFHLKYCIDHGQPLRSSPTNHSQKFSCHERSSKTNPKELAGYESKSD
ncbi:hypothetical protein BDW72DRAFT_186059 [Aspergillus terricola var. indicus]